MGNAVALRYEVKIEDLIAFNLFNMRHSGIGRDATKITAIILSSVVILSLVSKVGNPDFLSFSLPFGIFFILLVVWLDRCFRNWFIKRTVNRLYGKKAFRGFIGPHKLTLSQDGVLEETEIGEHRVNWEGVEKILTSDTHAFIYIGPSMAHVIPKSAIQEGDYGAFVEQAREWFEQKRPALQEA